MVLACSVICAQIPGVQTISRLRSDSPELDTAIAGSQPREITRGQIPPEELSWFADVISNMIATSLLTYVVTAVVFYIVILKTAQTADEPEKLRALNL